MRSSLAACLVLVLGAAPAFAGGGPAETVVLVNSTSADSKKVADYYARKRDIPREQVCEVKCGASLETSMDDFVRDVVDPLRRFLRERGMEDRCRFVVMTQGMPIRAQTPGGAVSTAAALSVLDTPVCGRPQTYADIGRVNIPNPYRDGPAPTGRIVAGGRFLLVTALISSTVDEAIALVDRSVASDGTAPRGARFVFQDASGNAGVRNDTYDVARRDLEALGFATERDPVGADAVKGRERVMGYMSGGSYSALTPEGVASNKYLPGAVCDMLQSFGAVPENFAPGGKGSQFPVTHMIRAGITGVHGAVSEPFSFAFPDVKLFESYASGYTLAEAFHQHLPIVYWMNLTLGDPLCAPYARRPAPKLDVKGAWEGVVEAIVSAPGASRIDVYVDGRAVASVTGERGAAEIDTTRYASGPHQLLVEATGPGKHEPRGWIASTVTVHNAAAAVGAPSARLRCDKIDAIAPPTIHAGDEATIRVTACGKDGKPLDGWTGRIEVRTAAPPVRWAAIDATSATAQAPLTFTQAGDYFLRITAPDDGCETTLRIRVDAAAFDHATTPASGFPLCQELDLEVVVEDRFGNRINDWQGSIRVEAPQDPAAHLPPAATLMSGSGGRCLLRGLVLTRAGPTKLVFKDGSGAVLSLQGEGVTVAKTAIRPWLVAPSIPMKDLVTADPSGGATGDGSIVAKALMRRVVRDDVLQLGYSYRPGKVTLATFLVTWVEAANATKARLLAAAHGRLHVYLDGKVVFDGVSKSTDPRGKREPIADLELAAGTHRLAVAVELVDEPKEQTLASFEIDDGAGGFPAALRIRARSGETPKTFVVSGRVTELMNQLGGPGSVGSDGRRGARGVTVNVTGADGKERTAVSDTGGFWFVGGLPPGATVVKVVPGTRAFEQTELRVTLSDANAVDVDFAPR